MPAVLCGFLTSVDEIVPLWLRPKICCANYKKRAEEAENALLDCPIPTCGGAIYSGGTTNDWHVCEHQRKGPRTNWREIARPKTGGNSAKLCGGKNKVSE